MDYFEKVLHHLSILETKPLAYPLVQDPLLREKGYRHIPVDNYLVFYVVREKEVQIRRVLYGGRRYASLL